MQLRRYLRFRLRTLLIAATLLCIALAFVIVPARQRRQAVLELQGRGEDVVYVGHDLPLGLDPLSWSQTWLGCDFNEQVDSISILFCDSLAEHWQRIRVCQPRKLGLLIEHVDDRDLARLKELRSLHSLRISRPTVTDQGMSYLADLTHLRTLEMHNITEMDLVALYQLHNLKELTISSESEIFREEIVKLRAALPHCKVDYDYTHKVYYDDIRK